MHIEGTPIADQLCYRNGLNRRVVRYSPVLALTI